MRRHKKLSKRKLQLAFITGSILALNALHDIYLYINMPDYSDLHKFSQPDIGNLIWSNVSVPLLSPRDTCPLCQSISGPEVLVMVTSSIFNFDRRAAIRNSWANTGVVRSGKIKVIFVIGQNLQDSSEVGNSKQIIQKIVFHPLVLGSQG